MSHEKHPPTELGMAMALVVVAVCCLVVVFFGLVLRGLGV